jgi:hypothetical protein
VAHHGRGVTARPETLLPIPQLRSIYFREIGSTGYGGKIYYLNAGELSNGEADILAKGAIKKASKVIWTR